MRGSKHERRGRLLARVYLRALELHPCANADCARAARNNECAGAAAARSEAAKFVPLVKHVGGECREVPPGKVETRKQVDQSRRTELALEFVRIAEHQTEVVRHERAGCSTDGRDVSRRAKRLNSSSQ